jgi:hypothetical protein
MAEGAGFEPAAGLLQRLLSKQVHSTTLPPFRGVTPSMGRITMVLPPAVSCAAAPAYGQVIRPVAQLQAAVDLLDIFAVDPSVELSAIPVWNPEDPRSEVTVEPCLLLGQAIFGA